MSDFGSAGDRSAEEDGSGTLDDRLALLADRDRRLVVSTLAGGETDRVPVTRLVEALSQASGDGHDPQRIRLRLHHQHLPRLQSAGVLTYDDESAVVRYHGDPLLEECLSSFAELTSD